MVQKKWTTICKKFDVDTDSLPLAKSNSKWIQDPKREHKTIKLLGNSTGETSMIFGLMPTSKI